MDFGTQLNKQEIIFVRNVLIKIDVLKTQLRNEDKKNPWKNGEIIKFYFKKCTYRKQKKNKSQICKSNDFVRNFQGPSVVLNWYITTDH